MIQYKNQPPKSFFEKDRKHVTKDEAQMKDIIPVPWSDDVLDGKVKVTIQPVEH